MQEEFSHIMNRLSENARLALQKSDHFSKMYNRGYMSTEHLLLGILAQDTSTGARLLTAEGVDLEKVEKALGKQATDVPGADMAMMSLSEATVLTLRMAMMFIAEQGLDIIGTEHILYALLTQPNSRASIILTDNFQIDIEGIIKDIEDVAEKQAETAKNRRRQVEFTRKAPLKWLSRYGHDLTELARRGKLDTVIGRDQEIERTITILCRRTKSNPVLIGEAGVGKTAIVEGLATRMAHNDVPGNLIGKHIYQVDLSSVVAGTKFRGEFEERLKGIIDEATGDDNLILFIDELHLLAGAGSPEGGMDAANILKPALARSNVHLIGATTLDEYRKNIEKDKALARRFQTVMVNEPSDTVTLRILKGVKKHYEKHHQVKIPEDILKLAITMSKRYINDRFMPDKVIDVIDEASAIAKVAEDKKGGGKYKKLKIEEQSLQEKIETAAEKEDYEKAALYKTRLEQTKKEVKKLEKKGIKGDATPNLTEKHLSQAISLKTGIPVAKVHGSELKLLKNLETHLEQSIIGQDKAVARVATAIRRGRSGITDVSRPIGSFLFMGPTGVGKTELARVIAREVFGGEDALIKIDMSEFGEKHNVSRLVGAPAGYIGYDDGGKLTEAVRRRPYSVVLFDEIEKAHPEVFNMLLQVLEDGVLTDGQGNKIKFNNTIIILTSNLGARDMQHESELGFMVRTAKDKKALESEYRADKAAAMKALKKSMRPELINRLDAVEVFRALTHDDVAKIFDNLIEELKQRLAHKSIGLRVSKEVKKWLIDKGFDPQNGARPLRRAIEEHLESILSDQIIDGKLKTGDVCEAKLSRGKIKLEVTHE